MIYNVLSGTLNPTLSVILLAMCQMRKSEEPLVVHRSLTWWLIDVCGSSAILLAVHLARTTIEALQRVSDKYRPTGSDQQEDLATLGSVQLRQTLALSTLASRLPGERPLLETNGDILWTQQRSSGVRSERRKRRSYTTVVDCRHSASFNHFCSSWCLTLYFCICAASCAARRYQPPGESRGTTTRLKQSFTTSTSKFTYLLTYTIWTNSCQL